MALEQPGLGSDPPNGLGWERGAIKWVFDDSHFAESGGRNL